MGVMTADLAVEMGELHCANPLLGDRVALDEAWRRDGYWFFRDVLDKTVIASIREVYRDYLVDMGLTDPDDAEIRYNGADYAHLPINSNRTRLNTLKVHRLLHEAPTINAFFSELFGCDPCWVPFTVHRTNPPVLDRRRSRFDFIHADGVYNGGLDFLICWVPIDEIDEAVGGLALVEGVPDGSNLHPRDGMKIDPIRLEDTPPRWKRAHYRPGDVLIMSLQTPHSGLANLSRDRFRLSMDTRIMPSSGHCPLAGTLAAVSAEGVVLQSEGRLSRFLFTGSSFIRGHAGNQMAPQDAPDHFAPGDEVIVLAEGERVVNLRPQH